MTFLLSNKCFFRLIGLSAMILPLAGCHESSSSCESEPIYFCPVFESLSKELPNQIVREIKSTPMPRINKLHFSAGMHIRNRYGLWGKNEITDYFLKNKITEPDAMSYVILVGYKQFLDGKPVNIDDLINTTLSVPPPPPLPGPTP